jgi:hypothetical protein
LITTMRVPPALHCLPLLPALAGFGGGGSGTTTASSAPSAPPTTAAQPSSAATGVRKAHNGTTTGSTPPSGSSSTGGTVRTFGHEAKAADAAAITTVVRDYLAARAGGDSARACSLLASRIAQGLARFAAAVPNLQDRSCAGMLARLSSQPSSQAPAQFSPPRVTGVRIEGERAFVLYRGAHDARLAMPMVRESGAWKVGELTTGPAP